MDMMDTNVILRYKRLCDCWICPDCACENMLSDGTCSVCGAYRRADSPVISAREEEMIASATGFGGYGGGSGYGGGGGYAPGPVSGPISGTPHGTKVFTPPPEEPAGGGGFVAALIMIVIAVIVIAIAVLMYQ